MKKRLLASLLSATILLSMTPMAFADEETTAKTQTTQGEVAVQAAQGPFDVDVENPYSDITVKSAVLENGVLTIKVGYAAENQMAGIGCSYTLYDEDVTDRAIARQIDADGNVQADRANITGTIRDCTVYTMTVPEDAEDLKVTVDGLTTWTYDQESKTLTISGSGAMADFTYTTINDKNATVDEQGLMSGVGENFFGGSQNTTRAMLMTILARMDGQDVTGGATWYEKAMNWAKQTGVSDGTMPEVNITREQLATMLYSYAKLKGMDPIPNGMALSKFSDADSISTWASEAVSWAAYSGIISGRSNGTVDPQAGATRAEMAVMLQQFVKLMEK